MADPQGVQQVVWGARDLPRPSVSPLGGVKNMLRPQLPNPLASDGCFFRRSWEALLGLSLRGIPGEPQKGFQSPLGGGL